MKYTIAEVSKADAVGGGASTVAEYLASGLRDNGFPTIHYCLYSGKGFNFLRRPIGGHWGHSFIEQNLNLKRSVGLTEIVPLEAPFFEDELRKIKFDLFHFHDISSAVSLFTLERISRHVPVLWTMHDCSPFTGGCLYPMDCLEWQKDQGCRDCSQIGSWPLDVPLDTAYINFEIRRQVFALAPFHFVSPSKWLADQASMSPLLSTEIHIVPNGIPSEPFEGLSKRTSRQALGINQEDLVLCFASGSLAVKRKNIFDVLESINTLSNKNVLIIALGNTDESIFEALSHFNILSPGYIENKQQLAIYMSASDIVLITSLAENHLLTVLEAMAAGTCVTGYAVGGVSEHIEDGKEGLLVPPGNKEALNTLISNLPSREKLRHIGNSAQTKFLSKFTLNSMCNNYIELFSKIINKEA